MSAGRRSLATALLAPVLLAACAGVKPKPAPPAAVLPAPPMAAPTAVAVPKASPYAPAQEDLSKRGDYTAGGLYAPHVKDSAPVELPDVDAIPEPEVRPEPRSRYGNRSPYAVLGKSYTVRERTEGYVEQGLASFYGNKFHGRRTSNLEVYDMYAFTAAHKTLPLPSFARVTNLSNGKSVVVRVNDRGPFHAGRVIDLSYAAAVKLGVHRAGTAKVEVRGLAPGDAGTSLAATTGPAAALPPAPAANLPRQLPPGVRIATGKPAVPQRATPGGAAATAIDLLVDALPIASAQAGAGERPVPVPATRPATTPAVVPGQEWRFDMRQDGKAMTADEFDAWMRSRRARVATGKPGTPDARRAAAAVAPAVATTAPVPTPATPVAVLGGVTLQVAAFGARDNAERALSMLRGAGIAGVRLQDGQANGQQVWRLRVGPVAAGHVAALSTRVAGLGFGQPQVVRE